MAYIVIYIFAAYWLNKYIVSAMCMGERKYMNCGLGKNLAPIKIFVNAIH